MRILGWAGALALAVAVAPGLQAQAAATAEPFVVEYYYKTRWGFAAEFIRLFRKNHLPVLRKEMETGRIVSVTGVEPRFHATEESRWDYRVTITFRSVTDAFAAPLGEREMRALFPDQETFAREEQRRFELLIAHWDVPIRSLALQP